jgi:hypothetical protein
MLFGVVNDTTASNIKVDTFRMVSTFILATLVPNSKVKTTTTTYTIIYHSPCINPRSTVQKILMMLIESMPMIVARRASAEEKETSNNQE